MVWAWLNPGLITSSDPTQRPNPAQMWACFPIGFGHSGLLTLLINFHFIEGQANHFKKLVHWTFQLSIWGSTKKQSFPSRVMK